MAVSPPAKKDRYRVGLLFRSGGMKQQVDAGFKKLGFTTRSPKYGDQVYWFPTVADFEKYRKDVFETKYAVVAPVPIFEFLEPDMGPVVKKMRLALEGLGVMATITEDGNDVVFSRKGPSRETSPFGDNPFEGQNNEAAVAKVPDAILGGFVGRPEDRQIYINQETGQLKSFNSDPNLLPPPPLPLTADAIYEAHAGRTLRLGEFAEELHMEPEALKNIIINDPRYRSPIQAGWIVRVPNTP